VNAPKRISNKKQNEKSYENNSETNESLQLTSNNEKLVTNFNQEEQHVNI
jgi:hypothetical protein